MIRRAVSFSVVAVLLAVACGQQRCAGPSTDEDSGQTVPEEDAGSDGGIGPDAGRNVRIYGSSRLSTWHVYAVAGGQYELETQETSDTGFRVQRWPIDGGPATELWDIRTNYSATIFPLGNERPRHAGVAAYGVNPNRYPAWYVIGTSAAQSVFASCTNSVIPLAGATSADESWVILPRDCSGACPSTSYSSYWHLRFGPDGGVSSSSQCFDGGGFSEPRAIHSDLTYEVRNVGLDFVVRDFVDGGTWTLPKPGIAKSWRFLPGEQIVAYGWEEGGRYTAPAKPPDDLQHELRLIRFAEPDAGYELLPIVARDHLVDIEVARRLPEGRLLLAGRPRWWWNAAGERRAVILSADARTVYGVWKFFAARYDLAEIEGQPVVVKQLEEQRSDGGLLRVVVLEAPVAAGADGGT